MSLKDRMDDTELLAEIEKLIEAYRGFRFMPDTPGCKSYRALKIVATDIRSRDPKTVNETLELLDMQIGMAHGNRSKTIGYRTGDLHKLAESVIGRWPMIEQALRKFGS